MKLWALLFILFCADSAFARVISPKSVEVAFTFSSEFKTAKTEDARDLVLEQARHLFGYLQSPELVREFSPRSRTYGVGAPRWEPEITKLFEERSSGKRVIHYELTGLLLLKKEVAADLLARGGDWIVELPYDLDAFFDVNCTDPARLTPSSFWYFGNPLRKGCEHLRRQPLARPVQIKLSEIENLPESHEIGLELLRSDNGNGELFEITSINGFSESSKKPKDDGRVNFEEMNQWFRDQNFRETVLSRFKNRPVHQFEKTLSRGGKRLLVRVTRLLAETDLDNGKNVTFAKFLRQAILKSDVIIYEGHSGAGASMDIRAVEDRLLFSKDRDAGDGIKFDRAKRQIFFFDACSSYSYYLGIFNGKKNPGTLAVISNGLESEFGFEIPMTKRLYRSLISLTNNDLTWNALLTDMEKPLRGNTFLLNVDLN